MQTKKLYLSAVNAGDLYQNLDRIDPVAAGKTFTSNSVALSSGSSATFAQTPAFCKVFTSVGGQPGGGDELCFDRQRLHAGAARRSAPFSSEAPTRRARNAFLTLTNAAYSGGILGWSGSLSTNVNFSIGETTFLVITSAQSAVSFAIQYNSASKPSAVSLPTTTVISLDQLGLYDAPYPGGNLDHQRGQCARPCIFAPRPAIPSALPT